MSLISTARALDDDRFLWRVRAAALNVAITKFGGADGIEKNFAQYIIDNPMTPLKTLEAIVANNTAVSAAVTVDQYNTVNTEAVTDSIIISGVQNVWNAAATRFDMIHTA